MAYTVMAYVINGLHSYGLHSHGLFPCEPVCAAHGMRTYAGSHTSTCAGSRGGARAAAEEDGAARRVTANGRYSYGPYSYGLYSYGVYSHGLYRYGLHSYCLYRQQPI